MTMSNDLDPVVYYLQMVPAARWWRERFCSAFMTKPGGSLALIAATLRIRLLACEFPRSPYIIIIIIYDIHIIH